MDKLTSSPSPPSPPSRIGIFGGSFNPIHTGHIDLARQILRLAHLDQIWFVVSPLNPFKRGESSLLDDRLRLALVRKALAGEPGLVPSDYEFGLPKPSYTWSTLQHLAADHPADHFSLIIGADNWLAFDRWAHPDYILAHFPIVVYPRKGCSIDPATLPAGVTLAPTALYPISSTGIRQRVQAGESVRGLVPESIRRDVEKYYR